MWKTVWENSEMYKFRRTSFKHMKRRPQSSTTFPQALQEAMFTTVFHHCGLC